MAAGEWRSRLGGRGVHDGRHGSRPAGAHVPRTGGERSECRPGDVRVGDAAGRRCRRRRRAGRSGGARARRARARRSGGSRGAGERQRIVRSPTTIPRASDADRARRRRQQRREVARERMEPGVEPACFAEHEPGAVHEAVASLQPLGRGQDERERRILVGRPRRAPPTRRRACARPRRESHATRMVRSPNRRFSVTVPRRLSFSEHGVGCS